MRRIHERIFKKDSIFESKPYYTIKITDNKNNRDSLVAFHKEAENLNI